jgi:hypothetical protein
VFEGIRGYPGDHLIDHTLESPFPLLFSLNAQLNVFHAYPRPNLTLTPNPNHSARRARPLRHRRQGRDDSFAPIE